MLARTTGVLVALLMLGGCPRKDAQAKPMASEEVSDLASDERVVFVPTFAVRSKTGWTVPIEAWVFEPEDDGPVRAGVVKLVEEALEVEFDEATSERVTANMRPFMVDNERGKTLVVSIGAQSFEVCTSEPDGTCTGTVDLARRDPGRLDVTLALPVSDGRTFAGRVHLLEDDGVSVLSDIDDTIKITEVHDKKKLIENTFVRPFEPTPGVAAVYRRWAKQGAAFHYVSNSPLPLLGAIDGFIETAGYPPGSLALKPFRWTDGTFLDLLDAPEDNKLDAIARHIDHFEQRRFVLVGDTGERDPEIYAATRRKYGERIAKIYLRDTGSMSEEDLQARMAAAFDGLPRSLWVVFEDGAEIRDDW